MEDRGKKYAGDRVTDYEDILYSGRPVSYKTNPMQRSHRAKQFAAFDALKGYEEAVRAREHLYEPYRELSSEKTEELDRELHLIHECDRIQVTWFRRKDAGNEAAGDYLCETGEVQGIDTQDGWLMVNDRVILFRDITDLKGECF